MTICAVVGCSVRSELIKGSGISLHKFPKDERRRKLWTLAIRRKNWKPTEHSVICSKHFSEDQIDRTSLAIIRLQENAIPNLFSFSSNVQKSNQRKKYPTVRQLEAAELSELKQITLQLDTPTQPSISVSPSLPAGECILPSLLNGTADVSLLGAPYSLQTDAPMHDPLTSDQLAPDSPQSHTSVPDTFQVSDSSQDDVPIPTHEFDNPTIYYIVSDAATLNKTPTIVGVEKLVYRNQELEEELKKSKAKLLECRKKIKALHQNDRRNKKRIEKLKAMLILSDPNLIEDSESEDFLTTFDEMLEWSVHGCIADDIDGMSDI